MSGGPQARRLKLTEGDSESEHPLLGKEERTGSGELRRAGSSIRPCHFNFYTLGRPEPSLAGDRYADMRCALKTGD
jgi:hypothetical protein